MGHALVVVDMQNLFVELADDGRRVLTEVNREVAKAVEQSHPVFYTRDYAPIDLPEGDPDGRAALHPELDVRGTVVDKGPGKRGGFSGFHLVPVLEPQQPFGGGSLGPLIGLLRAERTTDLTIVGIAADVCVAATARDAVRLGFAATIPLSATAFVHTHPDGDQGALAELREAGVKVSE